MKISRILTFIFILLTLSSRAQKINVSFSSKTFTGTFSGKVYLYLSKDTKEPMYAMYGIPKLTCFSTEVKNIKAGSFITFDDNAIFYPAILSEIERGEYYLQAVWDRNTGGRGITDSPDNMYSKPVKVNFTKNPNEVFTIVCSEVIRENKFTVTEHSKELKVPSALMSSFYKRPITLDAKVFLPQEYFDNPNKKFPVMFWISGFSSNYQMTQKGIEGWKPFIDTITFIWVFIDGRCPLGHSEYANSENNGPWGDALVNEFIPELEKKYRGNGARLIAGHSNGGWSVLWLQVNYPKTFAGCWSSAPDPIDFRCFANVDLYKDKNMFYDKDSVLRNDCVGLYFRDSYRIERVLNRGEQYVSVHAVFGKKAKDGLPEWICDPWTGEIDTNVVSHWKKYDISLIMRNDWEKLKPDIESKIRITAGIDDECDLDKPVAILQEEMKKLNSKMEFAIYPGTHSSVRTLEYNNDGYFFLAKKYKEWLKKNPVKD